MREKFSWLYKQEAENARSLHIHVTCATDSDSTSIVLNRSTCTNGILWDRFTDDNCSTRGDVYGQFSQGEFVVRINRDKGLVNIFLYFESLAAAAAE